MSKQQTKQGGRIMKKKKWQKPELIVLVRNEPEEAVLTGCKGLDTGASSDDVFDGCRLQPDCVELCSQIVSS
jgi:hypothetical protein